jgi:hypothetical protein
MRKNGYIIVGFILFMIGALSIILTLVGLKLDMVGFLYKIGSGFASLVHIILLCMGLAMMYVGKNFEKRERESTETMAEVSTDK